MSCSCTSSSNTQNELHASILQKINNHPCYSQNAHQHYARIHVAVAPACNIQCNYCNRKYDCSNESRPGVTSYKLSPEEAVKKSLTCRWYYPTTQRRRHCRARRWTSQS
ncbi:MAG: hypothetical protein LRY68_05340 [Sulfurospirillum sp.]|nr:hypothetical protein [Sulfurospirillum sp.]